MESTMVIKVKYGDTLRRFNASVNEDDQLDLDMERLRAKIIGLFNFPLDADLNLTYVDEDGDIVALVDDDDLRDVMKQSLKFLRIDVQLNTDRSARSNMRSSGNSTPRRSPQVQNPLLHINSGVADLLKSVPEPLLDMVSKLSQDLTSKAACANPVISELVANLSKMTQHLQGQAGAESSTQNGMADVPTAASGPENQNASKGDGLRDYLVNPSFALHTSYEPNNENVTRGVTAPAPSAPVDLNLDPPSDSGATGCTGRRKGCIRPAPLKPWSYEWPFSGMPVANESTVPPVVNPINSFKRSNSRTDPMVFHRGVQCDGCGAYPIVGPRYKSKVKEDYDLCSICYAGTGVEADYMKIDKPVSHRHLRHLKGFHDPNYWELPHVSHVVRSCGMKPVKPKLDSRFILDVNVLDGTMMAPSTPFTKIWRMRNSGTVAWPQGSRLVWIGGDRFSQADSVEIEIPLDGVPVDGQLDIAVEFKAPDLPGRYVSYWRMTSPSGSKFGQRVWVLIQVEALMRDPLLENFRHLNLNFPPECSGTKCPEPLNGGNAPPVVDGAPLVPQGSISVSEAVNPMVVEQPEKDQEKCYPNDNLLLGSGILGPAPSTQDSSPISYPIIDLSQPAPPVPSEVSPAAGVPMSTAGFGAENAVENTLLKELEEMGFKQINLNKEILRKNEYNLEQSVDDLCDVAEWDPILEELQEMGFCDIEMNKKLLKKNNGSIKGVVMDLLTGEKA